MTLSIRWTSSSAPSSPFSSACGALPQPRSRIALAAETRAACVAFLERMTPTRALIAVLVWLRASERISTRVLDMACFWFGRGDRGWENEPTGAHESTSSIVTMIRPATAIEIR